MAEVADALDYAHNQGVIHRDMKPSNLLLSPAGRLSINDFGLARMLEQPGMTMTGEFVGSPLYMSPEQITAGRAPLDHRTDIYSLGATLYELLTLQPPFPGVRRDQIIAQIIGKEPKPPRWHNKRIPLDLETICLKAMEKDPDRRYQTAGQMAEDLRRFVNRFAISAKRAGPVARAVKWVRRRPAVAGLIGAVVVVSVIAGVLAYRSHHIAERAELAEATARAAEGQRALDQALIEALSGHYDRVEPWLEKAEVCDVEPGRIRVLRGLAAVERGDVDAAVHELELAVQQLPESLGAHALLCRAYFEAGRMGDALKLDEIVESLEPVTPEDYLYGAWASGDHPERAERWYEHLAANHPSPAVHYLYGLHLTGKLADSYAISDIEKTLAHVSAARTQMPDDSRAWLFHCVAHLLAADIYRLEGDTFRFEDHMAKAKASSEALLAAKPDDGNAYMAAAQVAMTEGRPEDAVRNIRQGIGLPGFWPLMRLGLSRTLYDLGRFGEALAELDGMPEGLRASRIWIRQRILLLAESEGAERAEQEYHRWREAHATLPPRRLFFAPFEVHCLLGKTDEGFRLAREHFLEFGRPEDQREFDIAFGRFVTGELSDEALLAAASTRVDRNSAHYAIALAHFGRGDREGAMGHLSQDKSSLKSALWSGLGRVLLNRLREDPTWPPWIPMTEPPEEQP
jgi:tetratricopeptide (TPR) repeat protein